MGSAAIFGLGAGCSDEPDDSEPPDPPVPMLSITDQSVVEGDDGTATAVIEVSLSNVTQNVVTVDYATVDGTASAGLDYAESTGTLSFNPGVIRRNIEIDVIGDAELEEDETVIVTLSNPVNATLAAEQATLTITDDEPVIGLDARPQNLTCLAPPRPTVDTAVTLEDAYPSAPNFSLVTKILQPPGDGSRWYLVQKGGVIRTFDLADAANPATYLDLSGQVWTDSEGGALSMAFHPDFPGTPEVYVSYTGFDAGNRVSIISRFILDDPYAPANPTEEILITIDQDFNNHNGGDIAFGPDGYLYIGLGDGGSAGDPFNRAQNTRHLLGSFLRIDVLNVAFPDPGYQIPVDNPFAGNSKCGPGLNADPCPEIYAWGVRNPWRFGFDEPTGALWTGDVGQNAYEEVDTIELGGNYGWRCYEGFHDYDLGGCNPGGYLDPVTEYQHPIGESITGGYVYRGDAIYDLKGRYVFADYVSGRIWALRDNGAGGFVNDELIDTPYNISSFALGADGELYLSTYGVSRIYRLVEGGGTSSDLVPERLSETGCMSPGDITQPYEGLIPYDINAPFWSDGADKERYIALPEGATVTVDPDGDWDLPAGTVLVKNFRLNGNLIETRLMIRHPDGFWGGYTYEWNDTQTEADRVKGGKVKDIDGQAWVYPSEGQCMECHTTVAGFSLGLEFVQMNRDILYPSTGRTANQLRTLDFIGAFTTPLPLEPEEIPALVQPADPGGDLEMRARAYLHTNCAQCHSPGGPTPSDMDLRHDVPLAATSTCDELPLSGDLGIANARIIVPGDASSSILVERMSRRDAHGMPRIGSSISDNEGVTLLSSWIDSLPGCP